MINFKIYIRRYVPKIIRLLRESIYIDLMRKLGKRTRLLGMKEFPITLYGENAFFMHPFKVLNTKNGNKEYFAQFYGEAIATDYTTSKRGYLTFAAEVLPGKLIKKPYTFNVEHESLLPVSIVNNKMDGKNASIKISLDNEKYHLKKLKENRASNEVTEFINIPKRKTEGELYWESKSPEEKELIIKKRERFRVKALILVTSIMVYLIINQ